MMRYDTFLIRIHDAYKHIQIWPLFTDNVRKESAIKN